MILTTSGWLHMRTYGYAWQIPKRHIVAAYTALAIVVPVIVPVPLAAVLHKVLPDRITIRRT